jgi:hypothetical protein
MKTIKLTVGIKLILIVVITIIGISLFSAFKQSEGAKKYLNLIVNFKQIVIIDENNKIESVINADREYGAYFQQINLEMNNISRNGYKLINATPVGILGGGSSVVYTFEK